MTLQVGVTLTADAGGLRGELRIAKEDLDKLGGAADSAGDDAREAARGLDTLQEAGKGTDAVMRRLRQTLVALGGVALVRRIAQQADAWASTQAQIRLASEGLTEAGDASERLFGIAQEAGTALGDTVSVYRAIARTAPELDATADQVFRVTRSVQQLGAIGQTGTAQLSAGLLQFGQAMASGVVRAEELNSLLENIPPLAEAIAAGMGLTVGQLRQAVLDGEVLSRDVFRALLTQTDEIERQFAELPPTMTRASAQLRNELLRASGAVGEGGLTDALVDVIDRLREASESGDDFADRLGGTMGQAARLLGFGAIELAENIDLVVLALSAFLGVNAALHITRMTASVRAATGAWAALNAVMRANPLGLLATLAGTAAGAMIVFGESSTAAADTADVALRRLSGSVAEVEGRLSELTDAQRSLEVQRLEIRLGLEQEALDEAVLAVRQAMESAFADPLSGAGARRFSERQSGPVRDLFRGFVDAFQQALAEGGDLDAVVDQYLALTNASDGARAAVLDAAEALGEQKAEVDRTAAGLRRYAGTATEADEALLGLKETTEGLEGPSRRGAAALDEMARAARTLLQTAELEANVLQRLGVEGLARFRDEVELGGRFQEFLNDALEDGHGFLNAMEIAHRRYAVAVREANMAQQAEDAAAAAAEFDRLTDAMERAADVASRLSSIAATTAALRQQAAALTTAAENAVPREVFDRQQVGESAFRNAYDETIAAFTDPTEDQVMMAVTAAMERRTAALAVFDAQRLYDDVTRPLGGGGGQSQVDGAADAIADLEREAALQERLARLYGASEVSLAGLAEMREVATTAARLGIESGSAEYRQLAMLISRRNVAAAAIDEETQRRTDAQAVLERYGDAEDRHVQAVTELIALMPQLIALTGSRAEAEQVMGRALDDLDREYRELGFSAQFAEGLFEGLGSGAQSALRLIRDETATTADIVNAFVNDLIDTLYRLTVLNPLEMALEGLLGSIDFGALLGFGTSTSFAPAGYYGTGTGGLYHGGGVVGVTAVPTRAVDPRVWDGAPRYHRGGLVPGEVPVIARQGEVIGWPEQMRHAFGGSDVEVHIHDHRGADAADVEVRNTTQPGGGQRIDVMLRERTDADIRAGRYDRAMEYRFGLRPQGRR